VATRGKAYPWLLIAAVACSPIFAQAAEVTRVVSGSRARGELPDFNLDLSWLRQDRTAFLGRELGDESTGGRILVVKDLVYRQKRNVLNIRAHVGIFHDLSVYVTAPLVLSDERSLGFDRRGSGCAMLEPGTATPGCIDETNSTVLRDGILPGTSAGSFGLDAEGGRAFMRGSELVFRSPTRRGLEYLGVGVAWAAMNQQRDATKPTWVLRVEPRFAVSEPMRFDPAKPDANRGVGPGYHQIVFSSTFSRRFERFDPYLGAFYMLPLLTETSPFRNDPLGGRPQRRAGAEAGLELVAFENLSTRRRVTFEVRGLMELRFFGLVQSELWEPLSGSSLCPRNRAACRPDLDRDLDRDGVIDPHPGVTSSPSYGVFGANAGLNVYLGRHVRVRGLLGLLWEQDRYLSDGRSDSVVFDQPGRRFRVENAKAWHLLFDGGLLF
jgi:hypothetical protein